MSKINKEKNYKFGDNGEELIYKEGLGALWKLVTVLVNQLSAPITNIYLTVEYSLEIIDNSNFPLKHHILKKELIDLKNQAKSCGNILKNLLQIFKKIDLNLERIQI
ncbi:MAG: hypothetical protein ACFFCM_08080 [Promethearchaeota archaeon]